MDQTNRSLEDTKKRIQELQNRIDYLLEVIDITLAKKQKLELLLDQKEISE